MKNGRKDSRFADEDGARLVGGRLALEFANLRSPALTSDGSQEGYSEFVAFLAASGVIRAEAKPALFGIWETALDEAAGLLRRAVLFRGAVRKVFEARSSGAEILPDWIAPINEILAYTEGYDRLEPAPETTGEKPDWRLALHARAQGLEWLLTAIARSAAELIAEGPGAPIRKCANPRCGLFFYDDSRTGRRKWCSMAACGNRAKVAAHYVRQKNKQ